MQISHRRASRVVRFSNETTRHLSLNFIEIKKIYLNLSLFHTILETYLRPCPCLCKIPPINLAALVGIEVAWERGELWNAMGMRFLPATVPFGTGIGAVQRLCPVLNSRRRGRREKAFHEPEGQLGGSCTVHSWPPQLQRQLAALRLHTRGGCFSKWKQWIPHSISKLASKVPNCDLKKKKIRAKAERNVKRWKEKKRWACQELGLFQKKREKEGGIKATSISGSLGPSNHLRLSLSLLQRKFYHTNRKGIFYIKILKPLTHKYFRALTITDIYEVLIIC